MKSMARASESAFLENSVATRRVLVFISLLKKPLEADRTLLEHGFLPGCKRTCTRFFQMVRAPGFIRS